MNIIKGFGEFKTHIGRISDDFIILYLDDFSSLLIS